jgi:ubiquinone/menaquinone biosynthesis C-methylase UbiE
MEDKVKLWWKSSTDFIFQHIDLNNKNILEIGAGKGALEQQLPFEPQKIVFTEISLARVLDNRYKYYFPKNIFAVLNDANHACFKHKTFDIIILINVMMMVKNKEKTIKEYIKLLKNNGHVIIVEVLTDNIFYQINRKLSSKYKKLKIQNLNYKEIENICKKNNMLKKRYWYFFSILLLPFFKKGHDNFLLQKAHKFVEKIDSFLLNRFPQLTKQAVLCSVVLKKNK